MQGDNTPKQKRTLHCCKILTFPNYQVHIDSTV